MKKRSYAEISRRVEALSGRHIHVETAGCIDEFPVYHVTFKGDAETACKVLLTAGVHGNEPSGVEAVLHFLEKDHEELLEHFEFSVVPCVNPHGYVWDTRENAEGMDINRAFEEENVAEAQLVKDLLHGRQADCFVDFHEDWEAAGFYLYEGCRAGQLIGPEIIRQVETMGPIDPDGEDSERLSRGVYEVATSWGTKGLAPYVLKYHAARVIICEAPTDWAMKTRMDAHRSALNTVLKYYEKT